MQWALHAPPSGVGVAPMLAELHHSASTWASNDNEQWIIIFAIRKRLGRFMSI